MSMLYLWTSLFFLTHFLPIPLFLTSQSRRNPCRRKASVPFCLHCLQGALGLAGHLDMPMELLALDCPSCGQEIPQQAASGKHYVLSTATLLKDKWNTGAGRENNDCWEKASGLFVSDGISSEHVLWEEHSKNLDVLFLQLLLYQKKNGSWFVASYSCKRRNLPHTSKCGQPQDPNEEGPQGQLWAWPGHTEQAPAQEEENKQHQHPNPDPTQLPLRPSIIGLVSVQCSQEVRN